MYAGWTTFDANGMEDFVGNERQEFFVVAASGDIEPYPSAFQDAYLEALQIWRHFSNAAGCMGCGCQLST